MFLAHFLVPHSPYLLTNTCELTGAWETRSYFLGGKYDFDRDKIIDNYAIFFAVRSPDRSVAGHDCSLTSLPDLFVRYAKNLQGRGGKMHGHKTVFISSLSDAGTRVERAMPEFACFHAGIDQ